MRLSDFVRDHEHGAWCDADGCEVGPDKLDCVRSILGFCGCGRPEDGLRYVRDGLKLLTEKSPEGPMATVWQSWYNDYKIRSEAFFGEAFWFFAYWADSEDLTEHGGGVSSPWLSGKGQDLVADLDEALAEFDAEET